MQNNSSRFSMTRRDFLKWVAVGGVTVVGGYALAESAPWLNADQAVNQTWRIWDANATPSAQMQELVRYATLAANGHNTQPWQFAIHENVIEIHPDYSRRLPVVDPQNRELWISLGCALENLLIAARASGWASQVTYPDASDFIAVRLTADARHPSHWFDAIPWRQNTRSEYDGQPINNADLAQIQTLPLEPGVTLRFATTRADLETLVEYVNQGNVSQYADKGFIDELINWLRFNKKEALASFDGLYSVCSGNPEVPRWLGQVFVTGTSPQQQADLDAKKLRSSSAVAVIASESDSKSAWVRAGQVYERLALATTALNIKSAFLNQPIEVAAIRSQFASAMGLGANRPQLLMRLGYAAALPRSLRQPVEQVLRQS